jgi:hypothetical protein
MNRPHFFNYIEEKLNTHAVRISRRGKLNLLELNTHSENFYRDLLNQLFNWNLKNCNEDKTNTEAIDLICDTNKVLIQVSATCTKQKIESALEKQLVKDHSDYSFKFIAISDKDADTLRTTTIKNPSGISFLPSEDIYDVTFLLKKILYLTEPQQELIHKIIKSELGSEIDYERIDSDLTTVINILSKENLDITENLSNARKFDIETKISFNSLDSAGKFIDEYSFHHNRIEKIYSEFDASGTNKSYAVLSAIKNEYLRNLGNTSNNDELFFSILDKTKEKVLNSGNLQNLTIDMIDLYVGILIVDAFIRCKIFEKPVTL